MPENVKKDCRNSPFLCLSFIHIFYCIFIHKHNNPLYYHGNPYSITKTPSRVSVILQAVSVFV